MATSDKSFNGELLESILRPPKDNSEYVREIERNNRYRSCRQDTGSGYILDDRARLIDLYEACLQQWDAHIRSVVETLESQILGDRYMFARVNEKENTSRTWRTPEDTGFAVRQDNQGHSGIQALRVHPA